MSDSAFRHRDTEIDAYLGEIRGVPLLTAAEERNLASRLRRIKSKNDDERRDAHEAREQFVKANLRLVVNIARAFRNRGYEGPIGLEYRPQLASSTSWPSVRAFLSEQLEATAR